MLQTALQDAKGAGDNLSASRMARHLAQVLEFCGKLKEAHPVAQEGVHLADTAQSLGFGRVFTILRRSLTEPYSLILLFDNRAKQRFTCRIYLASVLRHLDRLDEARAILEEARQIQQQEYRDCPVLKGFWGFRLGQALISRGEYDEAIKTAPRPRSIRKSPRGGSRGFTAR